MLQPCSSFVTSGNERDNTSSELVPMPEGVEMVPVTRQKLAPGTVGQRVELIANLYPVTLTEVTMYHYHVSITSADQSADWGRLPTDLIMDRFMYDQPDLFGNIRNYYDGGENLHTLKQPLNMPDGQEEMVSTVSKVELDRGVHGDFAIRLKQRGKYLLSEAASTFFLGKPAASKEAEQAMNLLFHSIIERPQHKKRLAFGKCVSPVAANMDIFACSLRELLNSFRLTEFGLALNLHKKFLSNRSKTTDYKLVDLVLEVDSSLQPGVRPTAGQLKEINRAIHRLKVFTTHTINKMIYTIEGLVDMRPSDHRFTDQEGHSITVEELFKDKYKIQLYPYPLVKMCGRIVRYLPLEMCFLVKKPTFKPHKDKALVRPIQSIQPNVYFNELTSFAHSFNVANPDLEDKFGMQISAQPVRFHGRILPHPKLTEQARVSPQPSSSTAPKVRWGLFALMDSHDELNVQHISSFVTRIIDTIKRMGLNLLERPEPVSPVKINNADDFKYLFVNLTKKTNCELIFVGIPQTHETVNPALMYNLIKTYGEHNHGMVTQCFRTQFMESPPPDYFDGLLTKVNGKIGGQNPVIDPRDLQTLPFNSDQTMLVGVNVNHPGQTDLICSSISSVVGSYDGLLSQYSASIRVQSQTRDNIVRQFGDMMVELFVEYRKNNRGRLPENVILFRDAIGEHEFRFVLSIEIPQMQMVIDRLGAQMNITVIVTQKRHNTRFVLSTPGNSDGVHTFNVPSGTVVDQTIVNPQFMSFYLKSHFSQLGTSRPTKYFILRDDLNMSTDDLQKLCYYACHNCIRSRSVISIPTPVRYADLCANRSKVYIEAQRAIKLSKKEHPSRESEEDILMTEKEIVEQLNNWVKVNEKVRNRLYYC